jgi:protein transport protein SEC24
VIASLLNQIPTIFSRVKTPETALLPAINAALSALHATGGKIIGSICSLPTFGPGALTLRDDPKAHGTDAEKKLFTTENTAWRETAGKLAEAGVGVDMFIAAPSGTYMDVATIGELPPRLLKVVCY